MLGREIDEPKRDAHTLERASSMASLSVKQKAAEKGTS
jgi:hypothetical protein